MLNSIITLYIQRWEWFLQLLIEHICICAIAIAFAGVSGLLLGIYISEKTRIAPVVLGSVNMLYTIPSISLLGLLIPFLGIGNGTAITALTAYALLPMVRNTYAGLTSIDTEIIEAAQGMGSTSFQILFRIKLPLAMSIIIAGLRNMVVMTIAVAGIASFIGAGGLGVAIFRGITTNNAAMTFAGSLLIALLAISCDLLLGKLEKYLKERMRLN